ncbi:hypothetical protein [Spiroplasma cantharicola]|uniref:Uncharacterized protein n=1 Tax=Spiroplasma cantharicola TaxID=362837 RepID=A0A0M4JHV8_9MOLU|nr:hypothetical protein [Spiroplasma cantharicola]ALD66053.1 hypothetical protein SCANT_v1c01430 [Spiroplasma cantharicola]
MIFNKIEIQYEKFYLPLKIKYSEIRKPTFMEFLILLIIIEHPNKNKNMEEILEIDFNIKNKILFERALRELINFKVIEIGKNKVGVGLLNMHTPIKNFSIDLNLKEEFKKGTYTISQDNKFQDVKFFADPIFKNKEIITDINWKKRVADVKFTHKLSISIDKKEFSNKEWLYSGCSEFIKQNSDIFGDNSYLRDVLYDAQQSIQDAHNFEKYIQVDTAAIEAWIEIFDNGAYKIKTENKLFDDYLRLNPKMSLDILKSILNKYDEKIKKLFMPELNFKNKPNFMPNCDLFSNLNIKTSYNLMLVNDQFIKSDDEIIKSKELSKNIEIIIFYNSKRNTKVVTTVDNKLIFYVDYIDDEILQNNSFVYLDSKNASNSFLLANKSFDSININIPVIYKYKNPIEPIELTKLFSSKVYDVLEKFEDSLINKKYDISMNIYLILERLGLEEKVSSILENFLLKSIDFGQNYNDMKEHLAEKTDRKLALILEKVAKSLIIKISNERTDEELFDILENYQFIDTKNILDIFDKINMQNTIQNIYKINSFLEKHSIDGWKYNVRDSLVVLTKFFKINNRAEMFDENKYTSDVWKQHAETLNIIGKITKELYTTNYKFVEENYKYLLDSIIELVGNSLDIENFDQYVLNLSESLIDFYKYYYKYKSEQFPLMTEDLVDYKVKILAGNYINRIENEINEFIDKKIYNMPIELKLVWVKNVLNKPEVVDKILKNNDNYYKKALTIIFGKERKYTQADLTKYNHMFGGK